MKSPKPELGDEQRKPRRFTIWPESPEGKKLSKKHAILALIITFVVAVAVIIPIHTFSEFLNFEEPFSLR
jgi:hypothetical protein